MAYDRRALRAVHEMSVPYPAGQDGYRVPRFFAYATPDTLAVVAGAGYFNAGAAEFLVGDVFAIQHTVGGATGVALRAVTANTGGTVTIAALG